ncbi:hypothetical protein YASMINEVIRUS_1393 [Yasminevirus sp. GU-2018]|uniref:Uncharacterized protein n=1 Tax=Yasminevirus sp. GU-2018 TaxID=2420051 RepID=A0A5K0UB21_9VIRU|nr:hypothetical protein YASMINEVIRUS_1393 [Yasminevirus sp. GU-2018]
MSTPGDPTRRNTDKTLDLKVKSTLKKESKRCSEEVSKSVSERVSETDRKPQYNIQTRSRKRQRSNSPTHTTKDKTQDCSYNQDSSTNSGDQSSKRLKHAGQDPEPPEFKFDMICSGTTAKAFLRRYSKKSDDIIDLPDTDLYSLLYDTIKDVVLNNRWTSDDTTTNFSHKEHRVGDLISVSYVPDSQRYIEYYDEQMCTGKILFIDNDEINMFITVTTPTGYCIKTLEREGCHYFGMAKGYSHFISEA